MLTHCKMSHNKETLQLKYVHNAFYHIVQLAQINEIITQFTLIQYLINSTRVEANLLTK